MGQLIDSLNTTQFFIKDRPNPDVPLPGREADIRARQRRSGTTALPVEYPDETYMVLGQQLTNPYSIPIMTAAYNAYFNLSLSSVQTTHLYVRFTPQNETQVALLEDSLELDLYTHPLDHELLADGDLYVAPGKTIEDLPELYTVVTPSFVFPAGISYTVLAPIHIPEGDHGLLLEELAESMAAGATYTSLPIAPTEVLITRTDLSMSLGIEPQYLNEDAQCYITDPNGIYIGDCPDFDDNPPPPPPPPPSSCGLAPLNCVAEGRPRGRIRVWDTQLNTCVPVVGVRVKSKRWLTIREAYTDANGNFSIFRQYGRNTKVQVIFRNDEISVKPLRVNTGIRISLLPVKDRIGTFRGCDLNTIDKIYYRTSAGQAGESSFATGDGKARFSKTFLYWMAANAVNARGQQIAQGNADKVKPMEGRSNGGHRLQVYLSTSGTPHARGIHLDLPMLAYINKGITWNDAFDLAKLVIYAAKTYKAVQLGNVTSAAASATSAAQSLLTLVFQGSLPDAILYYNTPNQNLSSSEVYQKYCEAYTMAGLVKNRANTNDLKAYLKKKEKILTGILSAFSIYDYANKYLWQDGDVTIFETSSDKWFFYTADHLSILGAFLSVFQSITIFAEATDKDVFDMYTGFSEAYGNALANRKYNVLSDEVLDQNTKVVSSTPQQSSHIIYIENWKSRDVFDVLSTTPMSGIFYDLFDSAPDLINGEQDKLETANIASWENISKAGLGTSGSISSPQTFADWRVNIGISYPFQNTAINNVFNWYIFP